jgi:hypothetical protein
VIVTTWGSSVNPAEVVRVDPAARKQSNLTSFDVDKAAAESSRIHAYRSAIGADGLPAC